MKKIIVLFIIYAMFVSATPVSAASEDKLSKWAESSVMEAVSKGIVPDRLQSNYKAPITRDEFAELFVQTVLAKVNKEDNSNSEWTIEKLLNYVTLDVTFEDTNKEYIKVAYMIGAISGVSDTRFAPEKLITRQEAATMLVNTVHYSWGAGYSD
ncbi:MAG TPA: S-layer homology domain-containing protein [Anaerovoracaceae bacterium]|nr:S-layer homology domain-containing protein [Anaerovoracaceae bacterium]